MIPLKCFLGWQFSRFSYRANIEEIIEKPFRQTERLKTAIGQKQTLKQGTESSLKKSLETFKPSFTSQGFLV